MLRACIVALIATAWTAAAAPQSLPDTPGKETVLKLCGDCHGTAILHTGPKRTRPVWVKIVDQMEGLGVRGSEQEFATVVDYVLRHFGRINVNQSSEKEIQEVLELAAKDAAAIVKHRQQNGGFKDLAGLKKVAGVDGKWLDDRRDRILFQ